MLRIGIIIGSTRPGRNGEAVGKWVYEIAQKSTGAEFELVDIKDFNLPLLDEPVSPIMGQYSKPHTKVWAENFSVFEARSTDRRHRSTPCWIIYRVGRRTEDLSGRKHIGSRCGAWIVPNRPRGFQRGH